MPLPLTNEPRDLLLDDNNDIVITTDVVWSRGVAAVKQSCRIALRMFVGEWFLDLDAGIPYWDEILGQRPDIAVEVARTEFRRELSAVDGVLAVTQLDVTFESATRTMTVVWRVLTGHGETPVDTLAIGVPA